VFHDQSRSDLRTRYFEAWRKYRRHEPLEPLEAEIAAVIAEHPEYHWLFDGPLLRDAGSAIDAEFPPEAGASNPFLHLSLHLAIREQVTTDRPAGIRQIHERLTRRAGSSLDAEHAMLEILGEVLWEGQRAGAAPDENVYLERLRGLLQRA
jgi:hypothetical protein